MYRIYQIDVLVYWPTECEPFRNIIVKFHLLTYYLISKGLEL